MTIAHCPRCREQVTIPLGASPQARVRCPLCSDEYLLEDALRPLPPLLVVLHDPGHEPDSEVAPSFVPAMPRAAGLESQHPPAISVDTSEDFAVESAPPPAFHFEPDSVASAPRTTASVRSRARRKQASPVRMAIQTIGGGALGLAIAQLILWWMPGNWDPEKRDPFQLAVKVARFAPFIVPATLRGGTPPVAERPTTPNVQSSRPNATAKQKGTQAGRSGSTELPNVDLNLDSNALEPNTRLSNPANTSKEEATTKADEGTPESQPKSDANTSAKELDPLPDLTFDPATNKKDKEKATASETKTDTPAEREPPPVTAEVKDDAKPKEDAKPSVILRSPPDLKVGDISTRLAEFNAADNAWDTAQNPTLEQKRELITVLYERLRTLGEAVAVVHSQSPATTEVLELVAEKLKTLASQPDKLSPLGRLAGLWLNNHRDEGALVYGAVLSHTARDKAFEMQIRLNAKSEPVVTIVSAMDLSKELPVGANALVIGRMVSAPSKNLIGYDGDVESALLHGMHVLVPAN